MPAANSKDGHSARYATPASGLPCTREITLRKSATATVDITEIVATGINAARNARRADLSSPSAVYFATTRDVALVMPPPQNANSTVYSGNTI